VDLSSALLPRFDPARAVDPSLYGVPGRAPRIALRPASADEVAEALRAASRERLRVIPWGGAPAIPPTDLPSYDLALDLSALDRIVEYEPEDFTLTAQCGVTLGALRAALAERGQELPLEAADAGRATLGGVLAANGSGPRRLRFGSPRDRILGARFALADGTLARSGGKVVKNVAGFGIHRLLCGSGGGLAVIVEASLKLAPAPATRRALIYDLPAGALAEARRWAAFPRLEPALLTVLGGAAVESALLPGAGLSSSAAARGAGVLVIVGLEDDATWVEQQAEATRAALGPAALELRDADALTLWQRLADAEDAARERLTFNTAGNTPAVLAPLEDVEGLRGLVFHAPAGRLHTFVEEARAPALAARLLGAGFVSIGASGLAAPEPLVPPEQAVLALRRRIRDALDSQRILAFGESWASGSS
jgi:glycolate dehydrogenase FAD-binding subunit